MPTATKKPKPTPEREQLVVTTIRLPPDLKDWLESYAAHDGGRSGSSVIRAQLEQLRAGAAN